MYVVNTNYGRIQKFSSSGVYLMIIGAPGSKDGQLKSPVGVAADGSGNLYVADTGNNRIQKFSKTGLFLAKWGTKGS
jgi:tripartite motif-containing protein 71